MGKQASAPPPPDYQPVAAASEKAAELGYKLGGEQLTESKRQYDLNLAAAQPIAETQRRVMEQTAAQGQDYYDYMKSQQRPVEGALNAQALEADSSPESLAERGLISGSNANLQRDPQYGAQIAEEAATAGVDQMSGYSRALNIAARQGMRYGYSPAKLAAQVASQASMQGSSVASATNAARNQATDRARGLVTTGRNLRLQDENTGWAKKLDVAGLYRGLPGASQGAYQTSIAAGSSALDTGMKPGQAYLNNMGQGINTTMQGANARVQGANTIAGMQQQYGDTVAQVGAANAGATNQIIGTGLGIAGGVAAIHWSDRRLKENIELVGKTSHNLNLYEFGYKEVPGKRFRGVMADEVLDVMPEAVAMDENGFMMVNYDMLGLSMEVV